MKKLSELDKDTMLTVRKEEWQDISVMPVEDFINEYKELYSNLPNLQVTVADITVVDFNISNILEYLADGETYEDWVLDVEYEMMNSDVPFVDFINAIQEIFNNHPTYWEGEKVLVDIDNIGN